MMENYVIRYNRISMSSNKREKGSSPYGSKFISINKREILDTWWR